MSEAARPLAMRTPLRLRHWLFYRLYRARAEERPELFEAARLALAPRVRMSLEPTDVAHQPIAWAGVYELRLSRHMVRLARAGGLLVDVGANYGYHTCLWAAASPSNRVVAFEPSPSNVRALRRNVAGNGLGPGVTVETRAVGREEGAMSFEPGPSEQTGWGRLTGEDTGVTVDVVRLDRYCEEKDIGWIDVLKVDVEGADCCVLRGARRLLDERRIGTVFFEEAPRAMRRLGVRPGATAELLRDAGYRTRRLTPGEFMATPRRERRGS